MMMVQPMISSNKGQGMPRQHGPRDLALIYAERRLSNWAAWARENREQLGLPTISLLYKAMRRKAVRIKAAAIAIAAMSPEEIARPELTAYGHETRSSIPPSVGEVAEEILEVDEVVANLPPDLHEVIIADYFTYGAIEVRCKQTRWRRARYSQLLECAKYCVFAALSAKPA
jgi:hypothetical protein